MTPATEPRSAAAVRLLSVNGRGRIEQGTIADLPSRLRAGDLVVVNDAATAPVSVTFDHAGSPLELRLLRGENDLEVEALVLGSGDRSLRTEDRGNPPRLSPGAVVRRADLALRVVGVDPISPRHARFAFEGSSARSIEALYREGEVVQYSYVPGALELWDVQTPYAGRPWASEMPSAGRPLTFEILDALRRGGIRVTRITHGAGLSSSGDPALDRALPFRERYRIDDDAATAIRAAKARGGRVVAVGTTVVRALESAARADGSSVVRPGLGATDLRIGSDTKLLVVDALLTGVHEPGTSHFELLEAFLPRDVLNRASVAAAAAGFLAHEFGDSMLLTR